MCVQIVSDKQPGLVRERDTRPHIGGSVSSHGLCNVQSSRKGCKGRGVGIGNKRLRK